MIELCDPSRLHQTKRQKQDLKTSETDNLNLLNLHIRKYSSRFINDHYPVSPFCCNEIYQTFKQNEEISRLQFQMGFPRLCSV